jgi:hypothetical protein
VSHNSLSPTGSFLRNIVHTVVERQPPNTVVRLNDFRNRDVIRFCEQLLQKAIAGEITGLIYTARINEVDHAVSAIGVYAKDSSVGLPAMARMAEALELHVKTSV